jgi:hypothetical protein
MSPHRKKLVAISEKATNGRTILKWKCKGEKLEESSVKYGRVEEANDNH